MTLQEKIFELGPGCEQLTLFPVDFLASPFPWPESKREKTTSVTYFQKCSALSPTLSRISLSVRTYLESCELPLPTLSRVWSVKAMSASCLILKLRLSERTTEESESRLWPTATTMDHLPPKSHAALMREATYARKGRSRPANLRDCVQPGIERLWPTPAARDYKGANSLEHIQASLQDGKKGHLGQLPNVVLFSTPNARDLKNATAKEWDNPKNTRNLNRQIAKMCEGGETVAERNGQLNPTWVEWLMGFPTGWTELKPSETP